MEVFANDFFLIKPNRVTSYSINNRTTRATSSIQVQNNFNKKTKSESQKFNNMSLKGKLALITGGSRGIGAGIAIELAKEGADIAFTYASNSDAAQKVRTFENTLILRWLTNRSSL